MKYLGITCLVVFIVCLFDNRIDTVKILCQEQHIAKALGFKQRSNTNEYYWLSFYKSGAIDARNFCIRMGAELVHIKNESDNDYIKSIIVNETQVWLGGVYTGKSTFKWLTGFNMTYKNWAKNEPTADDKLGEYYVSMYGGNAGNKLHGYWNNINEDTVLRTLCVVRC